MPSGRGPRCPELIRICPAAALAGDRDTDAQALAKALDGDTPGLVLDFVWGPVAETACQALARQGWARTAPTSNTSRCWLEWECRIWSRVRKAHRP